jgi:uncharacterized delta-60 repeat protein
LQADGKLVLTGSSNKYILFILARLNSSGTVDNTFGTNGILTEQINPTVDYGQTAFIQPDGKLMVISTKEGQLTSGIALVRYLANGKADSSFGTNGSHIEKIQDFSMVDIHLRTDNKFMVAGSVAPTYPDFYAMTVARLDANGNLDHSYNGTGIYAVPNNGINNITDASLVQPDGKVIVAGVTYSADPRKICVARVKSEGGMDSTFGTNGITTISVGTFPLDCSAITLQSDGKVLITGSVELDGNNGSNDLLVVRLNQNGTLDNSFNQTGIKLIEYAPQTYNYGIAILVQPDGKIVIGEELYTDSSLIGIVRLKTDGTFDSTFNNTGTLPYGKSYYGNFGYALALGNQGRIYFGGSSYDSLFQTQMMLSRVTANGRPDSSFSASGNGLMAIGFNSHFTEINDLRFKPDGSLLLVGYAENPSLLNSPDIALVSLIPADGTLQLCAGGNTTLNSGATGASFQWQLNTGSGYSNLSDNGVYSGTHSPVLGISNAPSSYYGYLYRCIVDGVAGNVFTLTFINRWTGAVSNVWENPANWNCGVVPDLNTDVTISGSAVVLNSNTTIRSLTVQAGGRVTVTTGHTLTVVH